MRHAAHQPDQGVDQSTGRSCKKCPLSPSAAATKAAQMRESPTIIGHARHPKHYYLLLSEKPTSVFSVSKRKTVERSVRQP